MIRDKEISGLSEEAERMIKRQIFMNGVLAFACDADLYLEESELPDDLNEQLQVLSDSWDAVNQLLHHYGLMP